MHYHASFSIINHPLFPILMCYYIFLAKPVCSEGCGLEARAPSVSGQVSPCPDGVIPSMADGSKFFPFHNPSVGQNSGLFVANLICVTKLQNDCLLPNWGSHQYRKTNSGVMRSKVKVIYFISERVINIVQSLMEVDQQVFESDLLM